MQTISHDVQIYWVRQNEGRITAALVESAFSKEELQHELDEMRKAGPVRRVLATSVFIGEALKQTTTP